MKKAFFLILLTSALLLSSCRPPEGYIDNSRHVSETESENTEGNDPVLEIPKEAWTYKPIVWGEERIQYDGEYLYFEGRFGSTIYKYSLLDGTITSVCTDPFCAHSGINPTCRTGRHLEGSFYKVRGEYILYDVMGFDIYSYNTSTMENILLDDSREGSASNIMTVSDDYLYFMAHVVDEKTGETIPKKPHKKPSSTYKNLKILNEKLNEKSGIVKEENLTEVSDEELESDLNFYSKLIKVLICIICI